LRLEHRGLAAVDTGPALRVQPVPAEPAAQVSRVDGVEAVLGVDVDDPLADVEPVVVALVFLVLVERLAIAERPLAFAAFALGPSCDWHVGRVLQVRGRACDENLGLRWAACTGAVRPPGPAGGCPASHARPAGNPGRRLAGEQTDGAADAQEVDVPAPDEQRVRNTHEARITCNDPGCPGSVRHVDSREGHIRRHTRGNVPGRDPYSPLASGPPPTSPSPFTAAPSLVAPQSSRRRGPLARGGPLALPDPAERRLGSWLRLRWVGRRQMLAVAPGAARALLVVLLPARDADHVSIVRRRP